MTGSQFFPNGFSGRHMFLSLSIFFGTMFVVNGIFLYYAITTFNGLSTEDAYRKGIHYNERIGDAEAQLKLGWKSTVTVSPDLKTLTLKMVNKSGAPLRALNLDAVLSRPASNRFDISLKMAERNPGVYVAALDGVELGNWAFKLKVYDGAAQLQAGDDAGTTKIIYRMKNRIWLKQPK